MIEVLSPSTFEKIAGRVGLIDGDVLAYHASYAFDEKPVASMHRDMAIRVDQLEDALQAEENIYYLTGKFNFRNDVATLQQYKGNRYDKEGNRIKPQPEHLQAAKDWLIQNKQAEVQAYQEADDALAIAQWKYLADRTKESIISTIDKDLLMVPGLHHNMSTSEMLQITDPLGEMWVEKDKAGKPKVRATGLRLFYFQLLAGDNADHIPGLPKATEYMVETHGVRRGGCGQMAAFKALEDCQDETELLDEVCACYKSYWNGNIGYYHWKTEEPVVPMWYDVLAEQGKLLWMRTFENEDKQVLNLYRG